MDECKPLDNGYDNHTKRQGAGGAALCPRSLLSPKTRCRVSHRIDQPELAHANKLTRRTRVHPMHYKISQSLASHGML